jgi:hypothetical protein
LGLNVAGIEDWLAKKLLVTRAESQTECIDDSGFFLNRSRLRVPSVLDGEEGQMPFLFLQTF